MVGMMAKQPESDVARHRRMLSATTEWYGFAISMRGKSLTCR
jgi:hypothetical protein